MNLKSRETVFSSSGISGRASHVQEIIEAISQTQPGYRVEIESRNRNSDICNNCELHLGAAAIVFSPDTYTPGLGAKTPTVAPSPVS